MALVCLLSMGRSFSAADQPTPAPPALERFSEYQAADDPRRENKEYVGGDMRSVLFLPHTAAPHVKPVDANGCITIELAQGDTAGVAPEALGARFRIKYIDPTALDGDHKRKSYLYVPREEWTKGPIVVKPLGAATNQAEVCARDVWPVARRQIWDPVQVPPDAVLESAIGFRADWRPDHPSTVRFLVEIESHNQWCPLYNETLAETKSESPAWREIRIDLGAYDGQTVRLAFETQPVPGGPEPSLASPLWASPILYSKRPDPHRKTPNIVLISLDTLRADHLGCYGYHRDTSPNIDRFAQECTLFETAIAPAPWTTPSHASLFTGLHPSVHQAGIRSCGWRLREVWTTLAEIVRNKGYLTAALTEGIAIRGEMGFAQGFNLYSDGPTPDRHSPGKAEKTFARAAAWLERYGHLPFFLFVHTYEIHAPYDAPAPLGLKFAGPASPAEGGSDPKDDAPPEERRRAVDLYDGGIAYTDHHLGVLLDQIKKLGLADSTIVVILADHGEEFWEHGAIGHLAHVYDETLHVPLLIRLPGGPRPAKRVTDLVNSADIFATLLALLAIPIPPGLDSHSLLPLIAPDAYPGPYDRTEVVSQLVCRADDLSRLKGRPVEWRTLSVRTKDQKYITSDQKSVLLGKTGESEPPASEEELYDLQNDPQEKKNLASEKPAALQASRALLQAFLKRNAAAQSDHLRQQAGATGLTESDAAALRALGYLGD